MLSSQEDLTPALARIEVPVVVISGEHDRVDPPGTLRRELLPRLAQAQMHVLPRVGHLSPYEAPDHIADLVRAFVLSLGGDGDASRTHCTWCGISLAAAVDARLARTRIPTGARSTDPSAPRHRD
jgi:hypothetical protein